MRKVLQNQRHLPYYLMVKLVNLSRRDIFHRLIGFTREQTVLVYILSPFSGFVLPSLSFLLSLGLVLSFTFIY